MAIRTLTIKTRDGTQLDAWLCLPAKGETSTASRDWLVCHLIG